MSRLKGADLGVVGGSGGLNYRGAWTASPNPAYAVNDMVTRNGLPYVAVASPGAVDPAIPGAPTVQGQSNPSPVSSFSAQIAAAFTVNQQVTIDIVEVRYNGGASTGGLVVGIASDFSSGAPPFLGQGTSHALASGSWDAIKLNTPVVLQPGVTYRLVSFEPNTGVDNGAAALTGVVASIGNILFGTSWTPNSGYKPAMRLDATGTVWAALSLPTQNVNTVTASGAAQTLPDVYTATMHRVTLTANCTITLPAPGAGKSITVELVQDATGGRTVTWATPTGAIRWSGGAAPTVSPGANAVDLVTFVCIGGTNWYGRTAGQAFA